MIEKLKDELKSLEEGIYYLEETDMAYTRFYTNLCKKRRILKKAIRRLERLEERRSTEENLKPKKQNI